MHSIEIFRKGTKIITIKPEAGSTQSKAVMGDNVLNLTVKLNQYAEFLLNDYCDVFGERYTLQSFPTVSKGLGTDALYEYSLRFVAEGTELVRSLFLFLDPQNGFTEPSFSIMGVAQTFVQLIVDNANRVQPGQWSVGQVDVTGYKNLTFDKLNCYNALSKVAEEFATEFWIIGKVINLTRLRRDTGYSIAYGKYKGLYDITRTAVDNSAVVTRLYPLGADKNLPPNYGYNHLRLPFTHDPCLPSNLTAKWKDLTNGNQEVTFEFTPATSSGISAMTVQSRPVGATSWNDNTGSALSPVVSVVPLGPTEFRFITIGATCNNATTGIIVIDSADLTIPAFPQIRIPYLEKNISQYGLTEYTTVFDDVFPHRTGIITSVDATNPYTFVDTAVDFDLNDYRIPGQIVPKVTFNTGQLSGYTFDISKYDPLTKKVFFLKNKDENAIDIPGPGYLPQIGDEYVFVDIQMPQSYVDAAEALLLTKGKELLDKVSVPQLQYSVTLNPVFVKKMGWTIRIGDEIWIKDDELNIDKKIRVTQTVRNIVQEDSYQVQLSDTVQAGKIDVLISQQSTNAQNIQTIASNLQNGALFNNTIIGLLKILQDTVQIKDMPTHAAGAGFSDLLIEDATGLIYRKI